MPHALVRSPLKIGLLLVVALTSCASSATITTHSTATVTATATSTPMLDQRIDAYIDHLSQAQQIGQLLMVAVYADNFTADLNTALQQWHIANAIAFTNYGGGPLKPKTAAEMQRLIHDLQSHADFPLLVATDEEGGNVDRLAPYYGATPSPSALTATGNPQRAFDQAKLDAQRLHDLGINTDFAPLADVYQGGGALDPTRTFGTTVNQVTQYAGAFLDGLQQKGITGTLKHWPDLGAANANPDFALPMLSHTQAQLNATDFASFRNLLSHHPGMIMATHVIVPAYDAHYPASLSPTLVDGVLRGQLGYQGVVVTDAMDGNSIVQFMQQQGYADPAQGIAEASVLALLAGNDIVECPIEQDRLAATVAAVTQA
ncbi:MAG TPA: glycoside hydrolase family 3 N-terminal domain-containing protein, partial [Ktedonobacterales bacterium]|nr:glycoside hydrolase family 3 N-terminal domain-containing protein [Ktedonobacterales bacterium]